MDGFYGRVLKIDLNNQTGISEDIGDPIFANYLGGKGLGSYLLCRETPLGVDPLSPANRLIFATGPMTGNQIFG